MFDASIRSGFGHMGGDGSSPAVANGYLTGQDFLRA
jgi:hypothetical protein